jgi:endonuclease YncB( thermonuclease family)
VECRVKADVTGRATVQEVVASCSVDGSDLSLWVARNGWAEPASGGGFAIQEANRLAQKESKGRYAPEAPAIN